MCLCHILSSIQNTSPIVVPAMKGDLALVSCRIGDLQRGLGISKLQEFRKVKMISLSFWKEAC
jgi:hypothetical protein